MADYTTALVSELQRAVLRVVDDIAKDGLVALKSVLDDAGFGEFEGLKSYDVQAHVAGGAILFEILVDFDALDEDTKDRLIPREESEDDKIRQMSKTYALAGLGGATRRITGSARRLNRPARDARVPARDARRPARSGARDKTRGSDERLAGHQFALHAPRGMSITDQGKLSVVLEKAVQETTRGVHFPQGDFQGILGKFMKKLNKVVADRFAPELAQIIQRRLT